MSDAASPVDRNRLDDEASAYLAAHADNPVHWQPWDETARQAARERDQPIFLSIGYAACHWCHVMAEESFSDPTVAAQLNDAFVSVKVDREERPDLDSIYQTVCQRVTGRGGWPLSVWLTPDGRPFHIGTYYPPEPRRGTPGFPDVLEGIHDAWTDPARREELDSRADQWAALATSDADMDTADPAADRTDEPRSGEEREGALLTPAAEAAVRAADREHGGWGNGPKFPQTSRVELLLRAYDHTGRESFRTVATEALDAMAAGGIFDHVGGGFHRYATDHDWTVPHFEKMLYDNAELARLYVAGTQLTDRDRYATVARETLAFLERELGREAGGFDSSLGARSGPDREEGAYYTWTPDEVREAVDDATHARLFCERYGITDAGDISGRSVPAVAASTATLAADTDLSPAAAVDRAHAAVRTARQQRDSPPRDEKLLAGWNGLAIAAFAEAGLALDEQYLQVATRAAETVRNRLWTDESRLYRRYAGNTAKIAGYLEDYAYLGLGTLRLYEATGDRDWLAFSTQLARGIEREFWDPSDETLYFAPDTDDLVARPQELRDTSTPASTGVAVDLLDAVSRFTDDNLGEIASTVAATHRSRLESDPLQHATLVLAADALTERLELTLVGADRPASWREPLGDRHLHPRVLTYRPAADRIETATRQLGLTETPPIWAERDADGEPTVYACQGFVCSPPQPTVADALAWADRR